MLKSTEKGIIVTGEPWELTDDDRAEIAQIFNESMELQTPCRDDEHRWIEREKSPIRDTDNYTIYTLDQLENAAYEKIFYGRLASVS